MKSVRNIFRMMLLSCSVFVSCHWAVATHADSNALLDNTSPAFTPPGKLVDIVGRNIQLDCRGRGSPTVVFESGLGSSGSLDWSFVHDKVAKTARACAYSRAGILWSAPRDTSDELGKAVAEDLHAALSQAGEQGPFVLVGHSLGGPYAMIFTQYYADEIAGLVFVDASHPEQQLDFTELQRKYQAQLSSMVRVKPSRKLLTGFNQLQVIFSVVFAYAASSEAEIAKEWQALGQTLTEAGKLRNLDHRPVMVLTSGVPLSAQEKALAGMTEIEYQQYLMTKKWLHTDMASWSSNSHHWLVPDAGHFIQIDRPDVVIAAVRAVVESVRTHQRVAENIRKSDEDDKRDNNPR